MLKLKHSRIFYAGPTAGKTTLLDKSEADIIDTDTIVEYVFPEWFKEKMYAKTVAKSVVDLYYRAVGLTVGYESMRDDKTVFMTNVLASAFFDGILTVSTGLLKEGMIPIGFFREDPAEIVELTKQRGNGITLELAQKWKESAVKAEGTRVHRMIWLKKGQYLSEVLDIEVSDITYLADFRAARSPFLLEKQSSDKKV